MSNLINSNIRCRSTGNKNGINFSVFLITVVFEKRLKKERRSRKQLQDQLDLEIKKRTQLEDALKATGATSDQVRAITGNKKVS